MTPQVPAAKLTRADQPTPAAKPTLSQAPAFAVCFDQVARPYRWMEYLTFGRSLERCRYHFLPRLAQSHTALLLGDGDGRFLARLLAANPNLHADAIDSSPAMLRLLTRRALAVGAASRLRTHQANALTFTPDRRYDLVVTHFFLDCLTQSQLDALTHRIAASAQPHALWLVTEFRIPDPDGPMHWPARFLVRLLYIAFRILTGLRTAHLPNHTAALTQAGFHPFAQHLSLAGLLTTELWEYTPTMLPPQRPKVAPVPDPLPDPEPASPSLPEPDPGVFHHEPSPKPSEQPFSDRSCP